MSERSEYSESPLERLIAIIENGVERFLDEARKPGDTVARTNAMARVQSDLKVRVRTELSRVQDNQNFDGLGVIMDCLLSQILMIEQQHQKELGGKIQSQQTKMLESEN